MFKKLKEFFTGEISPKPEEQISDALEETADSENEDVLEESQETEIQETETVLKDEELVSVFITEQDTPDQGSTDEPQKESDLQNIKTFDETDLSEIPDVVQELTEIEEVEKIEKIEKIEENESTNLTGFEEITDNEPKSLFARLKAGLSKTAQNVTGKLDQLFQGHIKIDEELYEEIEEILITADIGFDTTINIVETLRNNIRRKSIQDVNGVREELKNIIEELLTSEDNHLNLEPLPAIMVVVGVNGVGKTTSIGKIAMRLKKERKSVMLVAADTFRAAAAEQLSIWAQRAEVEIIKHQENADPSAVIFDGIQKAKANKIDVLICDTAGRLHNKKNLMQELSKIFRIIEREYPEAKKEVLLVIDATTGQNAVNQVKIFKEAAPLDGIILTKLDGTAKGGVVLSVKSGLDIPIKLIGVGEKIEDLQDFDAKAFANALFDQQ